jgi:hypothetical protein
VNDIATEQNFVRKIYKDIVNGFSVIYRDDKSFAFKHLSEIESCKTNEVYINKLNEAKRKGLLGQEEKIKILCEQGVWSNEKEEKIKNLQEEISLNQTTLKKLIIASQTKNIKDIIKQKEDELLNIIKEKNELLELTAESYASKKSNEYIIYLSLYKKDLKNMEFDSENDFLELSETDLIEYIYAYREFMDTLNTKNIKKIAVCPFFINTFFLCEDNPYNFYGKPITHLTQFQVDLFSIARNYKYHLSKSGQNPPENLKSLDELVSWYEDRPVASALKDKNQDKMGQTYIGATKEELLSMTAGSKEEVVDLTTEAKKIGDELSFDQILKMHGI